MVEIKQVIGIYRDFLSHARAGLGVRDIPENLPIKVTVLASDYVFLLYNQRLDMLESVARYLNAEINRTLEGKQ